MLLHSKPDGEVLKALKAASYRSKQIRHVGTLRALFVRLEQARLCCPSFAYIKWQAVSPHCRAVFAEGG